MATVLALTNADQEVQQLKAYLKLAKVPDPCQAGVITISAGAEFFLFSHVKRGARLHGECLHVFCMCWYAAFLSCAGSAGTRSALAELLVVHTMGEPAAMGALSRAPLCACIGRAGWDRAL